MYVAMRTYGSSSSATSAVTNGTCSANAGRNARATTAHENNVPRPDTAVHADRTTPAARDTCPPGTTRSARSRRSASRRARRARHRRRTARSAGRRRPAAGNRRVGWPRHASLRQDERARHVSRVPAVHRDLAVGHLGGGGPAQLLHALDDVGDAEHVRVREQPAVCVERQPAARRGATSCPPRTPRLRPSAQNPMSSICIKLTTVKGS